MWVFVSPLSVYYAAKLLARRPFAPPKFSVPLVSRVTTGTIQMYLRSSNIQYIMWLSILWFCCFSSCPLPSHYFLALTLTQIRALPWDEVRPYSYLWWLYCSSARHRSRRLLERDVSRITNSWSQASVSWISPKKALAFHIYLVKLRLHGSG